MVGTRKPSRIAAGHAAYLAGVCGARTIDADVAIESAKLIQSQILVQAGLKTLQVGNFNRSLIASLFETL